MPAPFSIDLIHSVHFPSLPLERENEQNNNERILTSNKLKKMPACFASKDLLMNLTKGIECVFFWKYKFRRNLILTSLMTLSICLQRDSGFH